MGHFASPGYFLVTTGDQMKSEAEHGLSVLGGPVGDRDRGSSVGRLSCNQSTLRYLIWAVITHEWAGRRYLISTGLSVSTLDFGAPSTSVRNRRKERNDMSQSPECSLRRPERAFKIRPSALLVHTVGTWDTVTRGLGLSWRAVGGICAPEGRCLARRSMWCDLTEGKREADLPWGGRPCEYLNQAGASTGALEGLVTEANRSFQRQSGGRNCSAFRSPLQMRTNRILKSDSHF
ncbi:hypothetical protein AAFF_G00105760 [Aldrovandia affinis]|uniref:Uncharacterized protein n=1 Tax=Aldrovandia affinis TaxID=143900 RepID=A0AAD7WYM0_9TELE|nr:hypothetical protein AAFF_G00105760 [Aldrovandia affinis]